MQRFPVLASLTLLLALASTDVSAISYAYVPEDVRLMSAEFVVVGTMGDVKQVDRSITGTLTITETLKGKPTGKTLKLAWHDLSQFGGGRGHQNGQTGVWILNKGRDGNYATGYPGNFIGADQTKRVKQSLKDIDNMKWAEKDGLALSYIVEVRNGGGRALPGQPNPTGQMMIYPVVRNTSKKAVRICDFVPDHPFAVAMKTPTGSKVDANLYPRANNQKINARHFQPLEPGETRTLTYGLNIQLTEIGTYQITLSFTNKRDGNEFDLDDVWVGTLKTETRKVKTPGG